MTTREIAERLVELTGHSGEMLPLVSPVVELAERLEARKPRWVQCIAGRSRKSVRNAG